MLSDKAHVADGAMPLLVESIQKLSEVKSLDDVTVTVRRAARGLVAADGATFILQERGQCYYADEDAIGPLWKGKRFPIESCISGWSMIHKQQVAIEDIYKDDRIPHDAYRPTFVKSLLMTPVRQYDPIAAIGIYWAEHHRATADEQKLLQTLANTTAVALANVALYNELEQRVIERTQELELANAELETFAYMISHDLRTPLRNIQQISELVNVDALSSEDAEVLRLIGIESKRLAERTESLLKLFRYSLIEVESSTVDVSAQSEAILRQYLGVEPQRKLEMRVRPNIKVRADRDLIGSVLDNLLGNAWKYTKKQDTATIELGLKEENPNVVTFYIRDNGVGFGDTNPDKLFAPFQRFHASSEFPGTGVGLATVKRIVTRLGGRVWAESRAGDGATFYVELPAAKD